MDFGGKGGTNGKSMKEGCNKLHAVVLAIWWFSFCLAWLRSLWIRVECGGQIHHMAFYELDKCSFQRWCSWWRWLLRVCLLLFNRCVDADGGWPALCAMRDALLLWIIVFHLQLLWRQRKPQNCARVFALAEDIDYGGYLFINRNWEGWEEIESRGVWVCCSRWL